MTHPPYPHPDEPGADIGDRVSRRGQANRRSSWMMMVGLTALVALVVLMVVLHVSGVLGPGDHR